MPTAPCLAFLIMCELAWLFQNQQLHAITIISSTMFNYYWTVEIIARQNFFAVWTCEKYHSHHLWDCPNLLASPCHCKSYGIAPIQPRKYIFYLIVDLFYVLFVSYKQFRELCKRVCLWPSGRGFPIRNQEIGRYSQPLAEVDYQLQASNDHWLELLCT